MMSGFFSNKVWNFGAYQVTSLLSVTSWELELLVHTQKQTIRRRGGQVYT